jgi:hypothetical protein
MANTLRSKRSQFSRLADGEPASAVASSGAGRGTIARRQRGRKASTRSDRSDRSRRPPYVGKGIVQSRRHILNTRLLPAMQRACTTWCGFTCAGVSAPMIEGGPRDRAASQRP